MAGTLWPADGPRTRASSAEVKVYEALRRELPSGWTAWHSLRLRRGGEYEGEGDFVFAIPDRGMLVLEIKGGRIRLEGGRWLQNGAPMDRPPIDQARAFAGRLADVLRETTGSVPPFGTACMFPDEEFFEAPKEGGVIGSVLGARDLAWLGVALQELAARVIPARPLPRGDAWIGRLSELWGVTWTPQVRLADAAEDAARRFVELDREQLALLDFAANTTRALVEGAAGSGKTSVARELCARRAESGERVLYLCFTEALAAAVDRSLEPLRKKSKEVRACTVRRFASELLEAKGEDVPGASPNAWEDVSLRAACATLPPPGERPTFVVIDEAQDFASADWDLVRELVGDGPLWIFYDPRQRFWGERSIPADLVGRAATLALKHQHRNPPAIEALATQYAGSASPTSVPEGAADHGSLVLVETAENKVQDRVRHELDVLIKEGCRPSDIAIVSLRGQTRSTVAQQERIGSHIVTRADAPNAHAHVVSDTFLRFKGLDRPFVIVTEIDTGDSTSSYDTRMHIALTRATVRCVVVASPEIVAADARLRRLREPRG